MTRAWNESFTNTHHVITFHGEYFIAVFNIQKNRYRTTRLFNRYKSMSTRAELPRKNMKI